MHTSTAFRIGRRLPPLATADMVAGLYGGFAVMMALRDSSAADAAR